MASVDAWGFRIFSRKQTWWWSLLLTYFNTGKFPSSFVNRKAVNGPCRSIKLYRYHSLMVLSGRALGLKSLQQLIFFSVLHLVLVTDLPVLAPDLNIWYSDLLAGILILNVLEFLITDTVSLIRYEFTHQDGYEFPMELNLQFCSFRQAFICTGRYSLPHPMACKIQCLMSQSRGLGDHVS